MRGSILYYDKSSFSKSKLTWKIQVKPYNGDSSFRLQFHLQNFPDTSNMARHLEYALANFDPALADVSLEKNISSSDENLKIIACAVTPHNGNMRDTLKQLIVYLGAMHAVEDDVTKIAVSHVNAFDDRLHRMGKKAHERISLPDSSHTPRIDVFVDDHWVRSQTLLRGKGIGGWGAVIIDFTGAEPKKELLCGTSGIETTNAELSSELALLLTLRHVKRMINGRTPPPDIVIHSCKKGIASQFMLAQGNPKYSKRHCSMRFSEIWEILEGLNYRCSFDKGGRHDESPERHHMNIAQAIARYTYFSKQQDLLHEVDLGHTVLKGEDASRYIHQLASHIPAEDLQTVNHISLPPAATLAAHRL